MPASWRSRARCSRWSRPRTAAAWSAVCSHWRWSSSRSGSHWPRASESDSIQLRFHPALGRRAGHQLIVPALDIGKVLQFDLVARVAPGPAEDREVGDRQGAGYELAAREALVQHIVEPARLFHVAVQAVGAVLLVLQRDEMVHLARKRTEAAHLPHQPFIDRNAFGQRLGQEFSGLLAEIKQD